MLGELKKLTQYVDRPEISETYTDSIELSSFDGTTARIEFSIMRIDEPQQDKPPSGKRYTVCRLVIPAETVVDLFNRLSQLIKLMEQKGLVTTEGETPRTLQ